MKAEPGRLALRSGRRSSRCQWDKGVPGGVLIIIVKDKWRLERSESRVTTGALSYLRYEYRKTLLEAVVSINDDGRQYLCDRTA